MPAPVFVLGATGIQGGHIARHLRKAGVPVHALVRDPSSPKAKALEDIGVVLFKGTWDDSEALAPALAGTRAAFLNFYPSFTDPREEFRVAERALAAAESAGVKHVVYSGITGTENARELLPADLGSNAALAQTLQAKSDIVESVASIRFATHTILLPGKFMSDFHTNGAVWFGGLSKTGVFEPAFGERQRIQFVDADDIGAFGAAAIMDPEKFAGQRVEIVTEVLSADEAVALVAEATGKKMSVRSLTDAEVEERIKVDMIVLAHVLTAKVMKEVDMDRVKSWGVPLGSFKGFIEREKEALKEVYAAVPDADQ